MMEGSISPCCAPYGQDHVRRLIIWVDVQIELEISVHLSAQRQVQSLASFDHGTGPHPTHTRPNRQGIWGFQALQQLLQVHTIGVAKRVVFQKGGFGACSPGTKTGTRVHSDVPPERKPERGYVRMLPRNEKPERGHIRQNHPFGKPPFWQPPIQLSNCTKASQNLQLHSSTRTVIATIF